MDILGMESEDFFREGIFNQDLSAENGPTRSSRAQALQLREQHMQMPQGGKQFSKS